ncbi:MAG: ribonuclease III [Alphaproteobacteria bacterium]|nr:ribonuclease III [Alphaproteobacteria bacterium]
MSQATDPYAVLEKALGHRFSDRGLLETALTHASLRKKKYNNERLEFLGDRVLGLVVAEMLYSLFPDEKEGALAKRLTALVQRNALVVVAKDLSLADYMKLSAGEQKAGGLRKDTILADAVEALIGAVHLDAGFKAAEKFVRARWEKLLERQDAPPEDPKTLLQEWAQQRGLPLPVYKVVSKSGSDHSPEFEVELSVEGMGRTQAKAANKRGAEKEAAKKMLKKIGGAA